jgi:hypothetical protein
MNPGLKQSLLRLHGCIGVLVCNFYASCIEGQKANRRISNNEY